MTKAQRTAERWIAKNLEWAGIIEIAKYGVSHFDADKLSGTVQRAVVQLCREKVASDKAAR